MAAGAEPPAVDKHMAAAVRRAEFITALNELEWKAEQRISTDATRLKLLALFDERAP